MNWTFTLSSASFDCRTGNVALSQPSQSLAIQRVRENLFLSCCEKKCILGPAEHEKEKHNAGSTRHALACEEYGSLWLQRQW